MFELLNTLRQLLYYPFESRRSVKRSAPVDEREFGISPKMRRLYKPSNDEWYSSNSSDNSRRIASRKFSERYPTITLDDDDDIIEIKDVSHKKRPLQHTSTPARIDSKRNGSASSAYFSPGTSLSTSAKRPVTNGASALESASTILKKARESITGAQNSTGKSSINDLTFRLEEKLRYKELLEKTSPNVTFTSSNDSFSKYYTPVGKYFCTENYRARRMVDACKSRQKIIDSIDLTDNSLKKHKLRRSTSTAQAVIKILDDFDNDAVVVKDSDSDVEILPTPPSPKPDFKVERVNSLKQVVDACEFSDRKWLEEQNEKLRQNRESKEEKSRELEKCTRQLNLINRELELKCLEDLIRDSLTIKGEIIVPEVELPPLTEEQEVTVTKALSAPGGFLIVSKFNLNIYTADIKTLKGANWLNDNVINFYMNLIIERGKNPKFPKAFAFNTFFYPKLIENGYSSLRRWTKRVDIFSHDVIAVPIHLRIHWCMAIINFRNKSIRYYDSMGESKSMDPAAKTCLNALYNYLKTEHKDKKGSDYDMSEWQLEDCSDKIPQQMNGSDCGVFSCTFAEFLTRDGKLTFGQEDMPYLRRKMVYEIVTGELMIS